MGTATGKVLYKQLVFDNHREGFEKLLLQVGVYYDFPGVELRELRNLLSMRRKLKKLEHGLRIRIRNHLVAQYFPELDPCCHWAVQEGLAIVPYDVSREWGNAGPKGVSSIGLRSLSTRSSSRSFGHRCGVKTNWNSPELN